MEVSSPKRTAKISKRHMKAKEKRTRQESKLNRYLRSNQKIDETTKKSTTIRISPRRSSIVEKRNEKFESKSGRNCRVMKKFQAPTTLNQLGFIAHEEMPEQTIEKRQKRSTIKRESKLGFCDKTTSLSPSRESPIHKIATSVITRSAATKTFRKEVDTELYDKMPSQAMSKPVNGKNGELALAEAVKTRKKEDKKRPDSARKIERMPKPIFVVTRYNSAERMNKNYENL